MAKHPKRDLAVQTIKEHPEWRAVVVASHIGLIEEMGNDKAVEYIRQVRKSLKRKGELMVRAVCESEYTEAERLEDVLKLFELRKYDVTKRAASSMLLMLCYWTMREAGNFKAVSDTMELNDKLKHPLSFTEIEQVCNLAQERGFDSFDEEKTLQANLRGFKNAGLNYTSSSLFYKFEVTDEELSYLKTIYKPQSTIQPQGARK